MESKLEQEQKFYESRKKDLLQESEGKFALIKGENLVGVFDTAEAAYERGLKEFGNVPFLIKEIRRDERPQFIPFLSLGF